MSAYVRAPRTTASLSGDHAPEMELRWEVVTFQTRPLRCVDWSRRPSISVPGTGTSKALRH